MLMEKYTIKKIRDSKADAQVINTLTASSSDEGNFREIWQLVVNHVRGR